MQPRRAGFKVYQEGTELLRISTSLGKRMVYLVCFATLFIAFLLNFRTSTAFEGKTLPATLVYLLITLVCLLAALWTQRTVINRKTLEVAEEKGFPGITFFRRKYIPAAATWELVLISHKLLAQTGLGGRRLGIIKTSAETRGVLYRILLRSESKSCILAETSYLEEANYLSKAVGVFLGLPVKQEEVR